LDVSELINYSNIIKNGCIWTNQLIKYLQGWMNPNQSIKYYQEWTDLNK